MNGLQNLNFAIAIVLLCIILFFILFWTLISLFLFKSINLRTFDAFNLSLSLEKSNKVLFIEADIRRPSVLNGFYQFDREILGLGEIITGGAQLNEAIFKVPGTDLDIITSGEKRFDMSDIVNSEQIKKFFDTLKIEYDYVIID